MWIFLLVLFLFFFGVLGTAWWIGRLAPQIEVGQAVSKVATSDFHASEIKDIGRKIRKNKKELEKLIGITQNAQKDIREILEFEKQIQKDVEQRVKEAVTDDKLKIRIEHFMSHHQKQQLTKLKNLLTEYDGKFANMHEKQAAVFNNFGIRTNEVLKELQERAKKLIFDKIDSPDSFVTNLTIDRVIGLAECLQTSQGQIECYGHLRSKRINSSNSIKGQGFNSKEIVWIIIPNLDGDTGWLFLNPSKAKQNLKYLKYSDFYSREGIIEISRSPKLKKLIQINLPNFHKIESSFCIFPGKLKRQHNQPKGWVLLEAVEIFLLPTIFQHIQFASLFKEE